MKRLPLVIIISCFVIYFTHQAWAKTSAEDSYRVNVNDTLKIRVLDNEELTTIVIVAADGTISFPFIGSVMVKGKTLSEIKDDITKALSEGYIKFPVVMVSLERTHVRQVYLFGEVLSRGAVVYFNNITVMKALSVVGGVSNNGMYGKLIIRRKAADSNKYVDVAQTEIANGFINNRKIEDMILKPDDILIVEGNKTFLVQGELKTRGRMVLEKDMTVLRALLQAGGASVDGRYGKIKVRRKKADEPGGYIEIAQADLNDGVIDDTEVEDMFLEPDDILIVERNRTILIQGDISQRGRLVLEKDMTVLRALLQVGGVSENGLYGKIKVRRKQKENNEYQDLVESEINNGIIEKNEVENTVLQPDDILIIERSKTFLIQGEVKSRGRIVLEKDMTVLKALLQAGGVNDNGLNGKIKLRRKQGGEHGEYTYIAEAKISDGVIMDRSVEDMVLHPDDILIVERSKTYFIYGEVNKTGEFVLGEDMTVFKAITIAGGFTKWGSGNRVKILRQKKQDTGFETIKVNIDDVIGGDANSDISLEPGDTVVVSSGLF